MWDLLNIYISILAALEDTDLHVAIMCKDLQNLPALSTLYHVPMSLLSFEEQ